MKYAFALLVLFNVIALLNGATRFIVTFAQIDRPPAYFEGIEFMRGFLMPSLTWFVGITIVNLAVVGFLIFRRRRPAT